MAPEPPQHYYYQVVNIGKAYTTMLDKVNKMARGGTKQVIPMLDHTELAINVGTSIHNCRADPGMIGKLACLIMDLIHELTSRSKNESG
jgi:fructose-specific component phosphotransferase system IIB-like protein